MFVHAPGIEEFFFELEALSRSDTSGLAGVAALMRKWDMDPVMS